MNKRKVNKTIVVRSSTDNLTKVRDFIRSVSVEAGFKGEEINKIILAVDEACTNIIKHAYKFSPKGNITIKAIADDDKLLISLSDYGSHFEPNKIPEPNIKELHEKRRIGGLGMFLMRKLMDEVKYDITDKLNQVVLVKYLPKNEQR